MSKTLANTRSIIRSFLDETSASDWTDGELNSLINIKYHEVRSMVITTFEDYYLTTATLNSVANQQIYGSTDSVPTDIYKIRRVELNYDVSNSSGSPTRCFPVQNIDEIRKDLGFTNSPITIGTSSGANYFTYGFGSNLKIGFLPIPDKTGTNAIKIWYIAEGSDLSSDSSTVDIPYADKNYMVVAYGATADALRFGQQATAEGRDFDLKYENGKMKMQEELEDKISEESKMILDVQPINF